MRKPLEVIYFFVICVPLAAVVYITVSGLFLIKKIK